MQLPSHWPSAFSLTHPTCLPHASKPDVLLFSWKPLNRPHCPQDGTPFISTLMALSCPLRSMLSLTELPAVSTIGHVPSRLRTWPMLLSPFSNCLHSQFLVGSTPPGRPPAMRGSCVPCGPLSYCTFCSCSCFPSARQSLCWLGSRLCPGTELSLLEKF